MGSKLQIPAMVNTRAAKAALLVSVGLLAVFFVGTVLRFISRLASFAVLALLVVAAGYATYELYTGWQKGEETDRVSDEFDLDEGAEATTDDGSDTGSQSAVVSDEALDKELETLKAQRGDRNSDADVELDH